MAEFSCAGDTRRKRGPYKLYGLNPDDDDYNPVVPKTTKWRRLHVSNTNESNANDINDSSSIVGSVLSESESEDASDEEHCNISESEEDVLFDDDDLIHGLLNNTATGTVTYL